MKTKEDKNKLWLLFKWFISFSFFLLLFILSQQFPPPLLLFLKFEMNATTDQFVFVEKTLALGRFAEMAKKLIDDSVVIPGATMLRYSAGPVLEDRSVKASADTKKIASWLMREHSINLLLQGKKVNITFSVATTNKRFFPPKIHHSGIFLICVKGIINVTVTGKESDSLVKMSANLQPGDMFALMYGSYSSGYYLSMDPGTYFVTACAH